MRSIFLFASAISALTAVVMGAFGAHSLTALLSDGSLPIYQTAVNYQMWHSLGLGLIALIQLQAPNATMLKWAGWMMLIGIVLFSGSLYLLALFKTKWLGIITPLGGVYFILSWLLLAVFAWQSGRQK